VKGWGSPTIQGSGWHGKPANGDKLNQAHEELKATGVGLTSALVSDDELRIYPPAEYTPSEPDLVEPMTMTEAMQKYDMAMILKSGKFATRKAYGLALRALG